jgi:hypothetical protein
MRKPRHGAHPIATSLEGWIAIASAWSFTSYKWDEKRDQLHEVTWPWRGRALRLYHPFRWASWVNLYAADVAIPVPRSGHGTTISVRTSARASWAWVFKAKGQPVINDKNGQQMKTKDGDPAFFESSRWTLTLPREEYGDHLLYRQRAEDLAASLLAACRVEEFISLDLTRVAV